jgi:mRNA interferase MazF
MGLPLMPNGNLTYQRGEIWWVDLEPVRGNEAGKRRACLILQNDIGNQSSTTTIVAPLMPGKKPFPFVVNVTPSAKNGLDQVRNINLSQLRVVDAQSISGQLGTLEAKYWQAIETAVNVELGFNAAFS